MHLLTISLALGLAATTHAHSYTIPLVQQEDHPDITKRALPAAERRWKERYTSSGLSYAQGGYWLGNFTVGESTNLQLAIHTNEREFAINPGLYHPSKHSRRMGGQDRMIAHHVDGTTCNKTNAEYRTYTDDVSLGGITAENQKFYAVLKRDEDGFGVSSYFPHDGTLGFAGRPDFGEDPGPSFFDNLCTQGKLDECRFGFAFNTNKTGTAIIGRVDDDLFEGKLSTAGVNNQWKFRGGITLDGKLYKKRQDIILDTGTTMIFGPKRQVKKLFRKLKGRGVQKHTVRLDNCSGRKLYFMTYPCVDPPKLGLQMHGDGQIFEVEDSALGTPDPRFSTVDPSNGQSLGDICVSTIVGLNWNDPTWVLGSSWFQGKMVEYNLDLKQIGIAELKDKPS